MRYWDDSSSREAEVVWSGALYRQDEAAHSLCGPGWEVRENMLRAVAPERGAYPSGREIRAANLVPADDMWGRPAGHPHCQTCGRPTLQRRLRCAICQRAHDNKRPRKRSAA